MNNLKIFVITVLLTVIFWTTMVALNPLAGYLELIVSSAILAIVVFFSILSAMKMENKSKLMVIAGISGGIIAAILTFYVTFGISFVYQKLILLTRDLLGSHYDNGAKYVITGLLIFIGYLFVKKIVKNFFNYIEERKYIPGSNRILIIHTIFGTFCFTGNDNFKQYRLGTTFYMIGPKFLYKLPRNNKGQILCDENGKYIFDILTTESIPIKMEMGDDNKNAKIQAVTKDNRQIGVLGHINCRISGNPIIFYNWFGAFLKTSVQENGKEVERLVLPEKAKKILLAILESYMEPVIRKYYLPGYQDTDIINKLIRLLIKNAFQKADKEEIQREFIILLNQEELDEETEREAKKAFLVIMSKAFTMEGQRKDETKIEELIKNPEIELEDRPGIDKLKGEIAKNLKLNELFKTWYNTQFKGEAGKVIPLNPQGENIGQSVGEFEKHSVEFVEAFITEFTGEPIETHRQNATEIQILADATRKSDQKRKTDLRIIKNTQNVELAKQTKLQVINEAREETWKKVNLVKATKATGQKTVIKITAEGEAAKTIINGIANARALKELYTVYADNPGIYSLEKLEKTVEANAKKFPQLTTLFGNGEKGMEELVKLIATFKTMSDIDIKTGRSKEKIGNQSQKTTEEAA